MNPEFFIVPLIMGQVTHIISALKSGYIIVDCCVFALIYIMYYNVNLRTLKRHLYKVIRKNSDKQTIVLTANERQRSFKFRAIMHYLAKFNKTIYKIKEVNEISWNEDGGDFEKLSEYLVDQSKEFSLTDKIFGMVTHYSKEKQRGPVGTEYVDYSTMQIYSYTLQLIELQDWINARVKDYKQHLKTSSNDHQLYITVSNGKKKNGDGEKKNGKQNNIIIEAAPWESTITFDNSYFHDMDAVLKKIDFFLNNKAWYAEKGIPYNLGILLYGEPGCGKTRFIKQLMNHTGRHGIDIKLNDAMDFNDLYNIIFKEEISDDYIIPQNERILIFEDIDAMGQAVKCRDIKSTETTQKTRDRERGGDEDFIKVDAVNVLAELLTSSSNLNTTNNNNNLSYLLNMFDGINECSGRIIIMTSNKPEVLDKALIRPGRIDIKLNFQKCTTYDIMRLVNLFWDLNISEQDLLADLNMKYTSADIYNIFRSTSVFNEIREIFLK